MRLVMHFPYAMSFASENKTIIFVLWFLWAKLEAISGVLNVFLFGDFRQLPPVVGQPIYNTSKPDSEDSANKHYMVRCGQKAYAAFNDVFTLTGNHRQLNNKNRKRKRDDKQREIVEEFLRRLNKIGNGTCSDADFVYWKQYCLTSQRARNDFTNEPETVTSMFFFILGFLEKSNHLDHVSLQCSTSWRISQIFCMLVYWVCIKRLVDTSLDKSGSARYLRSACHSICKQRENTVIPMGCKKQQHDCAACSSHPPLKIIPYTTYRNHSSKS